MRFAGRFRFGRGAMHSFTAFSRSAPDKSRTGEGCWSRKASKRFPRPVAPFHLFLIKLSVRPGSRLAIAAQRFPPVYSDNIIRTSSGVNGSRQMLGSNSYFQRCMHFSFVLPGTVAATFGQ